MPGCYRAELVRLGHHNRREHALRLLARRHLLAGEPAAALARLDEVVRVEGDEHAGTQALRAWALLESGQSAQAARAVELAWRQGNQLDPCEALLVRGEVERRQADLDAAGRTLADGLARARAMPCPYAEGRLRYARARLFADLGQLSNAIRELELAVTIFRGLGARPYLRTAERLAASRGYLTSSSSTSNLRVELGGMGPAPRAP